MALSTYTELRAALGTWNMNKTNLPTADLVTLAEAKLQRELLIRVGESDNTLTGVVSSRLIALPTGFLEPVALFINTDPGRTELRFVPAGMDTSTSAGQPEFWSIDGTNVSFERPCAEDYSFTLRAVMAFTALSDAAPTNWLLTNHPDLYLAAGNVEAALWLLDDEQAARWKSRYDDVLTAVNYQAGRSQSLATMSVDPALLSIGRRGGFDINRGY